MDQKTDKNMNRKPIINTPPQGRTVAVDGDVYRLAELRISTS